MAQSNIAELKDEKRCTNKDCTYNNNTSVLKCEGCGAPME
jgi:ribosomal protein S27E